MDEAKERGLQNQQSSSDGEVRVTVVSPVDGQTGTRQYKNIQLSIMVIACLMLAISVIQTATKVDRHTRGVARHTSECGLPHQLTIHHVNGTSKGYIFDLCDVIECGGYNSSYRGKDVYLCFDQTLQNLCSTQKSYTGPWCQTWGQVTHYTGLWVPSKQVNRGLLAQKNHNEIMDRISFERIYSLSENPVMLSVMQEAIGDSKSTFVIVGVDVAGRDPLGVVQIIV